MKRKAKLDESHGAQRLEHDSKDLRDWANKTSQAMKEYPPGEFFASLSLSPSWSLSLVRLSPRSYGRSISSLSGRDVEACKANLSAHDALRDDINLNRPRFEDMNKLAEKLTRGGSPEANKIKSDNHELQAILKKLDEDWQVGED